MIQDKKHIEIVITKENDPEVDFKSRVKVNKKLEIVDKKSDISTEAKNYIKNHKKEYLDLINKALNKVNEIKN